MTFSHCINDSELGKTLTLPALIVHESPGKNFKIMVYNIGGSQFLEGYKHKSCCCCFFY